MSAAAAAIAFSECSVYKTANMGVMFSQVGQGKAEKGCALAHGKSAVT